MDSGEKTARPGQGTEADAARALFPRGLRQPEAFRFSLDSLLLACFVRPPRGAKPCQGLDLGAGCGVVGLALLLAQARARPGRELRVTGIELDPDMASCARDNVRLLGFETQYDVVQADVSSYGCSERMDFVLANPPYRLENTGRSSGNETRRQARFEAGSGLDGFAAAAARCLKARAPFCLVHLAERLDEVFACLAERGLRPKRLRLVHGRANKPARLVLVEARPGGGPGLEVEPPLVLYGSGRTGADQALTPEALAFCPFLECNAARGGADHA